MDNIIDFQVTIDSEFIPTTEQLTTFIEHTFKSLEIQPYELTIRIVGINEITSLNEQYRQKIGATNVLSFPFESFDFIETHLLGDVIICATVVNQEAKEQHKELLHHWAHMVVHGCLHLLGYDHITVIQAEEMEALEINILQYFKISNPYLAGH